MAINASYMANFQVVSRSWPVLGTWTHAYFYKFCLLDPAKGKDSIKSGKLVLKSHFAELQLGLVINPKN